MIRAACAIAGLLFASSATAGPVECQAAAGAHEAVKLEMLSRVQKYLRCIEAGDRNNACSVEFIMLEDSQSDLENAAEKHKEMCG